MQLKLLITENHKLKSARQYSHFSKIYSHLMKSVDYSFWANYIVDIHDTLGSSNDIALELASGNCKLSNYFKKTQFNKLYLSDLSFEMLNYCKCSYDRICFDMTSIPFKQKFDFIFSIFDSINYLNTEEKLLLFFNSVRLNMSKDGLLLFDVSFKKNSIMYEKELNRSGLYKGIKYLQKSSFNEKDCIHTNVVQLELPNGEIVEETHKQKIYEFYYYFDALESSGLFVLECFEAFTFNDANENSSRVQFIVKRNN